MNRMEHNTYVYDEIMKNDGSHQACKCVGINIYCILRVNVYIYCMHARVFYI
jgi:hypothetical protein